MLSNNGTQFTMPVAPACNSGYGNGGFFGGDGSWWVIILLLFLFAGWGNNGFGGYGAGGVQENYILASDFSQLSKQISDAYSMTERKLDGVNNGLCDGFYTNAQLINGVNTNILSTGNAIQNAITQDTIANMQNSNALASQLAQCCCDNRAAVADVKYTIASTGSEINRGVERGFADTNYNIATQANMLDRTISDKFCQTNFNAQTNTRDIVDAQNAGTQAILARLDLLENNRKDEKIAELQAKNFDLRLAASQEAQNNYLVSQLGYQCPKPAYVVQPPQQVAFATNCNGMATFANTGCGCGCGVSVQ